MRCQKSSLIDFSTAAKVTTKAASSCGRGQELTLDGGKFGGFQVWEGGMDFSKAAKLATTAAKVATTAASGKNRHRSHFGFTQDLPTTATVILLLLLMLLFFIQASFAYGALAGTQNRIIQQVNSQQQQHQQQLPLRSRFYSTTTALSFYSVVLFLRMTRRIFTCCIRYCFFRGFQTALKPLLA